MLLRQRAFVSYQIRHFLIFTPYPIPLLRNGSDERKPFVLQNMILHPTLISIVIQNLASALDDVTAHRGI